MERGQRTERCTPVLRCQEGQEESDENSEWCARSCLINTVHRGVLTHVRCGDKRNHWVWPSGGRGPW